MTTMSKRGFMEGRPKKYTDPEVMQQKINDYFDKCDSLTRLVEDDKGRAKLMLEPYTVSGLCLALDMDRMTLLDYEKDPMFSGAVKKAKMRIENWIEKRSLSGDLNPTVSIFNLKNNFGWVDKQEVETTDKTQENYEKWLKDNQNIIDVTPKKQIA